MRRSFLGPVLSAFISLVFIACSANNTGNSKQVRDLQVTVAALQSKASQTAAPVANTQAPAPAATKSPTATPSPSPTPSPTPTPKPTPPPVSSAPIGGGCPEEFPVKVTANRQFYTTDHPAYAAAAATTCFVTAQAATGSGAQAAPIPTPPPTPVSLQGTGQTATRPVTPPASVSVVTLTHNGRSNFIVHAFHGGQDDSLTNAIGPYQGSRPLFGTDPVTFDIHADGAWTIRIDPVGLAGSPAFSGKGDAVSGLFDPPAPSAWEFMHNGRSNFIVHAICAGGQVSVQNEIGPVNGSGIIQFQKGPCLWGEQADGNWSLNPRQ